MTISATVTPVEWLHSLGAFLNDFYEAQCKAVKANGAAAKKSKEIPNNSKLQNSVKKAPPSTVQRSLVRRSSLTLSTPLKDKDNSPINLTLTTPKPSISQLSSSATPFTEGRSRRTAATKADKYIDIVSRRLAEVPANGSTPKSMKIASKLISEATPNSRRTILLSQTLATAKPEIARKSSESIPQSTPNKPSVVEIPAATPASVRKRKRAAKIHQMFETPLISLATAASSDIGSLSPAAISMAPSTISKTRLNQTINVDDAMKRVSPVQTENINPVKEQKVSPVKAKTISPVRAQKISPVKRSGTPPVKSQRVSPQVKAQKINTQLKAQKLSPVKVSPVKRSQRVSPIRAPTNIATQTPSISATPKAPVVEFVAPQSVLRSSKRPRKPVDTSIYSEDASNVVSPAMKKQAKFSDVSIFPTVSINSTSQVKITPQTPVPVTVTVPVAPVIPISTKVSNVPTIIVPLTAAKTEESSSNEDLPALASTSKRTPLRVQPSRTPTRTKSAIPSLSDYSAAAKIAVIEVAKNANSTNNAITPKVEPWTSKFIQKESTVTTSTVPSVNLTKSALNVNIKPVDTSKISGFTSSSGTAAVPIVPRFPLNLANISNITKPSSSLLKPTEPITNPIVTTKTHSVNVTVPESPLSRAKRIDSENSSREEKLKLMMEIKKNALTEVNKPMEIVKATETPDVIKTNESVSSAPMSKPTITLTATENVQISSKLPVKPKSSTTVLPSPKIPSRLAEAFSGIDSELPPIDIGLVDDEKILKNVLNDGYINPKMKKQQTNMSVGNNPSTTVSETQTNSQLHRTAVLNSAARKVNVVPEAKDKQSQSQITNTTLKQPSQQKQPLPSTPKPQASSTKLDTSSPSFPEILSDDELDKREKIPGKENRPTWAMTPNLTVALNAQRSQRAEDVFGKVQPIKLEDFFKGSGKKFPNRSSTSNWNNNI